MREAGMWNGSLCFLITYFWKVRMERDWPETPVHREEEQFLRGLCDGTHHSGMSRGYIQDGHTHITEGPLRGKERLIRKIDRHKRLARLEMPGNLRDVNVGLEIYSKV